MVEFQLNDPSIESQWRALILFGKNSATYKFAFAKALLEVVDNKKSKVTLEELSKPFADSIVSHLRISDKQGTASTSTFLDKCREFINGKISNEELYFQTERLGFVNVVQAFQVVNREVIPDKFYEVSDNNRKELVLTDNLLKIKELFQFANLEQEVEARWRLVETAWDLNLAPKLIEVQSDFEESTIFVHNNLMRRINITSVRDALNGYQKGKCFYSGYDITIQKNHKNICEVDHFLPHINKLDHAKNGANINGVWNLVLADPDVNLNKLTRIPDKTFLEKLYQRNEYYIESNLPLAETIINQTGFSPNARRSFLEKQYNIALQNSIHTWNPKFY